MERRKHNFLNKNGQTKVTILENGIIVKKCNHVQFYEKYKVFIKMNLERLKYKKVYLGRPVHNSSQIKNKDI